MSGLTMEGHQIVDLQCIDLQYGEEFAIAGHENQVFAIVQAEATEVNGEEADDDEEFEEEEQEEEEGVECGQEGTSAVGKKRTYAPHWPTEVTQQLISTRLGMESAFAQGTMQRKLWRDLAAQMAAHGHQVKASECLNKWKNLLSTYRKNKEKAERGGERSVTWEHFRPLHEAFGQFAHDLPPASYLRASTSAGLRSSGWTAERFVQQAAAVKAAAAAKAEADQAMRAKRAAKLAALAEAEAALTARVAAAKEAAITKVTAAERAKEAKRKAFAEAEAAVTARWAAAKARAAGGSSGGEAADPTASSAVQPPPPPSRKRKGFDDTPPDWFLSAVRQKQVADARRSEQRDQLWSEFRQLEERKTAAMAGLMTVAARLRDKSGGDRYAVVADL